MKRSIEKTMGINCYCGSREWGNPLLNIWGLKNPCGCKRVSILNIIVHDPYIGWKWWKNQICPQLYGQHTVWQAGIISEIKMGVLKYKSKLAGFIPVEAALSLCNEDFGVDGFLVVLGWVRNYNHRLI